jgi:mercuric ion transport protein
MTIELIYDHDCPNADEARTQLRRALSAAHWPRTWTEWERSQPECPNYVAQYGSPTILVNGRDVAGEPPAGEASCRLYIDANGAYRGTPTVDTIVQALTHHAPALPSRSRWKRAFSMLPLIGAVVLPKLSCPACWPAYAALLSSLGLSFVNYTPYLFPLTLVFACIVLVSVGYRARTRHGFGPLGLASLGSLVLLAGKFVWALDFVMYAGLGFMISASIWNAWPARQAHTRACATCQ